MSSDTDQSKQNGQKSLFFYYFWLLLVVTSFWGMVFLGSVLVLPPFIGVNELSTIYLIYSVLVIVFFHAFFFCLNAYLQKEHNRTLPMNTKLYLEYAYAILISLSLFQIFFMTPDYIKYMIVISGDEDRIATQIQQQAQDHLNNDCSIQHNSYFPPEYCEKLKAIVDSKKPREYIIKNILDDSKFLDHVIDRQMIDTQSGAESDRHSPIRFMATNLRNLRSLRFDSQVHPMKPVLSWCAALLLPVGLSLRVVKTSLGLFGKLQ